MRKKIINIISVIIIGLLLAVAIWILSLIRCQYLTILHIDEFYTNSSSEYLQLAKTSHIIDYGDSNAILYCIGEVYVGEERVNSYGVKLYFVKNGAEWIEKDSSIIWSSTGSASSVIWPYWWHFIYGGL